MAPVSTFDARIAELAEQVGSGTLTGSVTRDQAYAQYQHEGAELNHENGQWKYQETALLEGHEGYLQNLADAVLHGDLTETMAEQMEALDAASAALTPKDTTILARSGHPMVKAAGNVVWERAPEVPRLTDAELEFVHGHIRGTGAVYHGPGS